MSDLAAPNARLLVFGYLGGRNFGDELMLLGLLAEAERAGASEIRIITPDGTLPVHLNGRVSGAYAKSLKGILTGLRWSDTLAVCGGTMFHDAFDDDRHRQYRKVLGSLVGLCLAARALGNRLVLLGIGVGPLRRRLTRQMLKLAIGAASLVTVRDQASLDDIANVGSAGSKVRLTKDLSLSARQKLPPARPSFPRRILLSSVPAALTALVPRLEAQEFLDLLARGLSEFLAGHPEWRVTVLEVAVGKHDNDAAISGAMVKAITALAPGRVERLRFAGDPHSFLAAIGGASAVIASRYHIATAAELIGVPTFWIPYQRKVLDGGRDLGVPPERMHLPDAACADMVMAWLTALASRSPISP